MTGDELTRSLAAHLRARSKPPIVFTEIALMGTWGSHGRLDVAALTIAPHYAGFSVTGFEVKASRKDLFQDVDKGKYRRYLGACERFFLALPSGLAKLEELPSDIGVMTCSAGRWTTARRSPSLDGSIDKVALLRMIRRLDDDREALEKRETKLDRLQRMARYAEEKSLRFYLSEQAREVIRGAEKLEADARRRGEELDQREAALAGAPEVLELVDRLLASVTRHVSLGRNALGFDRWRSARRDEARQRLAQAVDAAERDLTPGAAR